MAKVVKKTTSKKKAAATRPKKKSSKAKAKGGKNIEKEKLAKELKALIPKLDEEGLAFLVKQAQVHLYNMLVDALNKTIIKDVERAKKSASGKIEKPATEDFSDIKISETGSSYYIVYHNEWIAFSKEEITAIVKIALGEGTELEIKERLFNWLSRERNDLLYTASIAKKFDNKLVSLINLLRENFKLRKK
jgi:glyceraldehyde-3-phosphate dehydrogenase/erythrose-4-phosphate dehydrogenase